MTIAALRADCARCAALCCVALAFDRSPLFGFDKTNGEVCPNLDTCGRCRIHADKARRGFAGCAAYDCIGAGQKVTQDVFAGRSWRDDDALLAPMLRAFERMLAVQELLLLLNEAEKLPLSVHEREMVSAFEAMLEPAGGWSEQRLAEMPVGKIAADVRGFLTTLRRHVTPNEKGAASDDAFSSR